MSAIRDASLLITGAGSGLGRELAHEAARRGARLILWDIDARGLERVAAEIKIIDETISVVTSICDVTDTESVRRNARAVLAHNSVDILINNAGIVTGKPLLELTDEQIERSFRVNSLALFWVVRAFLPAMQDRQSGHLVTVASAAGLIGVPNLTDYGASKWAAVGFDEALRMELRKLRSTIKTTVVCPYYLDTGMFEGVRTRFSFLLPILKKERVARKILDAVEKNRRRLWLPPLVYSIPLLRLLPTPWFDWIATTMGINASMDHFVGRSEDPRNQ